MKNEQSWWCRYSNPAVTVLFVSLASACGGDDSGGGGHDTEQNTGAQLFSVGGTVSGLSGADLVLQNNHQDELSLSSDGHFVFAQELPDGADYLVTIQTQPSGQNCAVASDSGLISGADVSNVVVSCVDEATNNGGTGDGTTNNGTDTSSGDVSYAIVDTNQTNCYNSSTGASTSCSGAGHDADYQGNQPSYTLSDGGLTVTDNVTGLVWLQSTDTDGVDGIDVSDKMSQSAADSYCSGLGTAGRSWRLPSIKELYSLILFSGKDASNYMGTDTATLTPFIDSTFDYAFGDQDAGERIIDGQYASSTLYVSTTMNGDETMFGVNFVDGRIKGYPVRLGPSDKTFYVRCVSENTRYGTNVFKDNGDGTVSDTATGLMWQQDDTSSTNWEDAVSTCEATTTAGHSDWRLPDIKELQSILDYTRSPDTSNYAAIDNNFFNATSIVNEEGETDWGYYWASTTHVDNDDNGSNATYMSFGRALGYFDMQGSLAMLDVHGAGAQRSNDKLDVAHEGGAASGDIGFGTFYYHGPQGDILRLDNKVRCVRTI